MPILYTIPTDGPSLTQYLKRQWLDKCQKNHLRTCRFQVGPYTHPKRNNRAKKDGKLRPIMDYRALNSWTVHDTYPLPLIGNIINHLQGKTLFTKFDIQWGYNNICIREEDQWKAAFKTPYGLYQPKVMYFGLTNSPPTFC